MNIVNFSMKYFFLPFSASAVHHVFTDDVKTKLNETPHALAIAVSAIALTLFGPLQALFALVATYSLSKIVPTVNRYWGLASSTFSLSLLWELICGRSPPYANALLTAAYITSIVIKTKGWKIDTAKIRSFFVPLYNRVTNLLPRSF